MSKQSKFKVFAKNAYVKYVSENTRYSCNGFYNYMVEHYNESIRIHYDEVFKKSIEKLWNEFTHTSFPAQLDLFIDGSKLPPSIPVLSNGKFERVKTNFCTIQEFIDYNNRTFRNKSKTLARRNKQNLKIIKQALSISSGDTSWTFDDVKSTNKAIVK